MTTTGTAILRALALAVGVLGIVVYLYLAYSAIVPGWYQTPGIHDSWERQLGYIIQDVIFFPGLPPLIVAVYFLVLGRSRRDWSAGFGFVIVFLAFHYVVAVWMSHASASIYLPMMVVELLAAVGLIWYWHRVNRRRI